MLTLRPFPALRRVAAAALAVALLMPALRARAVMADQLADATAPVDDPRTPGPDLYAGRNFDLVPDMPDPVAMIVVAPPRPLPVPAPSDAEPAIAPASVAAPPARDASARAPPAR